MNKSVKTKENGLDLAVIADDAKKMSGFGTLNLARDTAIPYISILQTSSPQVNPSKAEHIESAKAGQLFNTVTQETFDTLEVIPVFYHLKYVEWKPREQGGGFINSHDADSGIIGQTYAFTYKLSSVSESNDRGSWFGFAVEKGSQVTDASIYGESKAFAQSASSGAVDAKPQEPKLIQSDNKPETEKNEDVPF